MRAIRIHEKGGPEKLRLEEISIPEPGPGQVRFRVEAAGINFIDIYQRSGLYPMEFPITPGLEAAGVVTALGPGMSGIKLGDRVASPRVIGGYAEEALAPAEALTGVPAGMDSTLAAALLLQGMTAHYLATDTFPLKPGDTALVHAAAGGVGLLLVQIAKLRGARVIGVVGSEAKVALARGAGADEVVVTGPDGFAAAAKRFSGGAGVDVVYDAVGKDTFEGSLDSLRPRGMLVSYGNASGPVPPFSPLLLMQKGSLFLTRPNLAHYLRGDEARTRAGDLFRWVAEGKLKVRIGKTFPLAQAAEAHRALESRATTGKLLLLP